MRKIISIFVFCLLFGGLINCQQTLNDKAKEYLRPVVVPAPLDNPTTKEKIELGKMLFFDPRMSGSNWISCATCHNPALGWSDGLSLGFGHDMKPLSRNTPTILNTAYQTHQFWDGRAETLEEQALGPVESSAEMSQDITVMIGELEELSVYKNLFDIAFPKEGLTRVNIAKALAAYERTIVSGESPFDRYLKGNLDEIDVSAKRGFVLFENKAQCSKCHSGFNFSDNGFHNIGLKDPNGNIDEGRWGAIGKDAPIKIRALVGAFKTPTLRDVALTAPYMHNGMYKTLEEVVDHYDRGGDDLEYLDPNMIKLKLTSEEKKDLVSFLKTLTGEQIQVVLPNLPQN